jgi:hypothetical protein
MISPQRRGTGGNPVCYQTAVLLPISMTRSPSPYQPGTSHRCQAVLCWCRTCRRVASRFPFWRGRPFVPGGRNGAGS